MSDTLTSVDEAPAVAEPPPARPDLSSRVGWAVVSAMTVGVGATWLRLMFLPLGDFHSGRVDGRYALHARNLFEKGLIGSDWSADWSPYGAQPYAHWPPLRNVLAAMFGWIPGDGAWEPRIGTYTIALLAIPAGAALLRAFGIRWIPTLVAVGLMIGTPYFWVYGNQKFDLALILAVSAVIVRLRRDPDPPRWLVAAAAVLALLATTATWPGIAVTGLLLIWLVATRRKLDRAVLWFGGAAALGLGLSLLFIVGITGLDNLVGQTEMRTGGGVTWGEFVLRQGRYYLNMLPYWYLALLPFAAVAGLMRKQTRAFMVAAIVFTGLWSAGLRNGAYIHQFWGFVILVPGLVGMGVLLDRAADLVRNRRYLVAAASAALTALTVFVAVMAFGATADRYYHEPARAGALVMENPPAEGQRYAWNYRLPAARWLAYYWNLPPRGITEPLVATAAPTDLVVLRLDRLPAWLPAAAMEAAAVHRDGRYVLVRMADVQAAAEPS